MEYSSSTSLAEMQGQYCIIAGLHAALKSAWLDGEGGSVAERSGRTSMAMLSGFGVFNPSKHLPVWKRGLKLLRRSLARSST
jgi:hypothetical protein